MLFLGTERGVLQPEMAPAMPKEEGLAFLSMMLPSTLFNCAQYQQQALRDLGRPSSRASACTACAQLCSPFVLPPTTAGKQVGAEGGVGRGHKKAEPGGPGTRIPAPTAGCRQRKGPRGQPDPTANSTCCCCYWEQGRWICPPLFHLPAKAGGGGLNSAPQRGGGESCLPSLFPNYEAGRQPLGWAGGRRPTQQESEGCCFTSRF